MKPLLKIFSIAIVGIGLALLANSCKKDSRSGYVSVNMTDAPANYLKVNVEILDVQVHNETQGWVSLPTNVGIYNLLDLQNNATVALASEATVPAGKLNQMRMVLGSHNSLIVNVSDDPLIIVADTFDLKVPSGEETGLKMNLSYTLSPDKHMVVLLDFDAAASVVDKGNGTYSLKPVIKVKSVTEI